MIYVREPELGKNFGAIVPHLGLPCTLLSQKLNSGRQGRKAGFRGPWRQGDSGSMLSSFVAKLSCSLVVSVNVSRMVRGGSWEGANVCHLEQAMPSRGMGAPDHVSRVAKNLNFYGSLFLSFFFCFGN